MPLLRTSATNGPGRRRSAALGLTLALMAGAAAGCGSGDAPADITATGPVVLYTSMPQPIVDRLELVFEEVFPDVGGNLWVGNQAPGRRGIDLQVVRASTGALLDRIMEEDETGGLRADVVWLADPATMETLKERGLLARYSPPAGTPIADRFVDPDGFYVAGRVINMVVAWNTSLLPDGMQDWPDLITAGHRRRAFPDPASGSALAAMQAMTEEFGDDFFFRFARSGGRRVDSSIIARDAVAGGDYEAAGVLDFLVRQARDAGAPIDLAYPTSGAVVIPSPLAISATTGNRPAAEAFADFVLSRQGQEILVTVGSFYSVRTDVGPPSGAPPLIGIRSLPVDWASLRTATDELTTKWEEAFTLAQQRLS